MLVVANRHRRRLTSPWLLANAGLPRYSNGALLVRSSNSSPLSSIKVLQIIGKHLHISLNDFNITHKRFHCSLVNCEAHILLAVNVLELWNLSLHKNLIIEELELISVESQKLDIISLVSLVHNMNFCL